MASTEPTALQADAQVCLPRVTFKFCTQCKWMLRAAYYAQELLSTFSTSLGEVSLIPSTGGVFTVEVIHMQPSSDPPSDTAASPTNFEQKPTTTQLWDRRYNGGFPEVKHLKQLVRNIIDPTRDLGHVDRDHKETKPEQTTAAPPVAQDYEGTMHPKQDAYVRSEGPAVAVEVKTDADESKKVKVETCEDCS